MATFGASVNVEQMELMIDRGMRPILWFDNDGAGWNATEQVGAWLMQRTVVQAVQCPYVGDPADLSDELFEKVLSDHVVPFPLWRRPIDLLAIPEEGEPVIRKTGQAAKIIESEIARDVPTEHESAASGPEQADPAAVEETPAQDR